MSNIMILDCTLRDGGRIIDCKYKDSDISNVCRDLTYSGIDIIEMGFLRDDKIVNYNGNSTFFTDVNQINKYIPDNNKTLYVAFIDYDMYDFSKLRICEGNKVKGIRVGFTKKQFKSDKEGIVKALKSVKEKGYKLFIQGVNSLGYTDKELLDVIEMVNDVMPYSFGIVDTYGGMYLDDITHIYGMVEHNLNSNICIDIHSHNNFQSSFAFAQEIIRICDSKRNIILDSTLNGMGKCAGNLNTELIIDYLNRKKASNYDLDRILGTIDSYLSPIKEKYNWGYSIPAFMAGIYKSHPNNIIYLTQKYRLNSKDIKYIISAIDDEKRQRYDYDNIQRIYNDYFSTVINDDISILNLRNKLVDKKILVLAPGKSIIDYEKDIKKLLTEDVIVVSVNFIPDNISCDYHFYANAIHWDKISNNIEHKKCILSSNIKGNIENVIRVNYASLICEDSKLSDNSTMMLLNLLEKCGVKKIMIAGFDGLKPNEDNYVNSDFINSEHGMQFEESNRIIRKMFENYLERTSKNLEVVLVTPSIYYEF